MIQPTLYVIEIGREGNRGVITEEICFASCFVGDLGKIVLAPVHAPEAVAIVAHASRIDRVDDDAGALRLFDHRIHIGIGWASAPKLVDAVGYYENLATKGT